MIWAPSEVNVGTRLPRGIEFRVTPYLELRAWKFGSLRVVESPKRHVATACRTSPSIWCRQVSWSSRRPMASPSRPIAPCSRPILDEFVLKQSPITCWSIPQCSSGCKQRHLGLLQSGAVLQSGSDKQLAGFTEVPEMSTACLCSGRASAPCNTAMTRICVSRD